MVRTWARRSGVFALLAMIGGGAWAVSNWDSLQTQYALRQLKSATTDEDRAARADALAARDGGTRELVELARHSDEPLRGACVAALARHLESLPPADSRGSELSLLLIEGITSGEYAESLSPLLPTVVQRIGGVYGAKCRAAVSEGLKSPSASIRTAAIRAAVHPGVNLRTEVVALLNAPEAEVRRAAMFAVGPASDSEAAIGDEDLFKWLHDPDADVRSICRAALVSRGRSDSEIGLGKRLVDPDAGERLKLLLDLRFDDELPDVEPWLERLSHDVDPGVRAGAARVAMEINVDRMRPAPAWVVRLADADPNLTVRRIAKFYRTSKPMADVEIRLVEGP